MHRTLAGPCPRSALAAELLDPGVEVLQRLIWTAGAGDLELLAALLGVRDKEFLHLRKQGLAHVVDGPKMLMTIRVNGHSQKAVVLLGFPVLGLLGIDHAD